MTDVAAWALALGVLGAIAGSFLATLVIRWPQERSVMRGRSACDGCGRRLGPLDLIPLVPRAKCRTCGGAIDQRHWQIEWTAAAIGAITGFVAPGVEGVAGAVFGWLLLTLAALDVAEFWLPDRLTATLALTGLAGGAAGLEPMLADRLIGGAVGFGALWAIANGYRLLRGREGMGGGDPKLLGAIGLWLGWRMLPAVLLLASATGLALVLVAYFCGKAVRRDDAVPFGALLAIAAYPAWLVMVGTAP